jgi:hypothetical protein
LKAVPIFLIIYSSINFWLFKTISDEGSANIVDGVYVLQNHGSFVRELTELQYNEYKANNLRGFSGHWMLFYSMSMAILYPWTTKKDA